MDDHFPCDSVNVANYRPVSLTYVVYKVFENIVKRTILPFLSECNAITSYQHGFLPHRSSISNLLILEETVTPLMDDGYTADVVYLDFAEAFHSFNHM